VKFNAKEKHTHQFLKCEACQLIGHDGGPQDVTQAPAASKQWRFADAVPFQNVCFHSAVFKSQSADLGKCYQILKTNPANLWFIYFLTK
jgi:hypothetical protein